MTLRQSVSRPNLSRSLAARLSADVGKGTPLESLFRGKYGVAAALVLGFIAFLPYPAYPVGGNTGLQLGDFFSIFFALPLVFLSWKRNPYYLFGLILVPLCLSAMKVAILQEPGLDVCVKSSVSWSIFCVTILAAQLFLPTYLMEVLTGIAVAAILHVVVGAWQMYVFATGGELPLQFLYVNPSFYSVPEMATTIVRYIQRPFGLFPEPSAMSSSLAPWVLLWVAEMCGLIKFAVQPAKWQRALFTVAAIGSLLLIILSRSGHAMVTLAMVLLFVFIWLRKARATFRNYLTVASLVGIVAPAAIILTINAVGDRVTEVAGANESWQNRSFSLLAGFEFWTHNGPWTLLFGNGCGLLSNMIAGKYGLEAVWSVLLVYIYENGIPGAIVSAWIGIYMLRVWRITRFNAAYAGIVFVWLVGITVTTSYNQLLPIWFTLGLLTIWPLVCETTGKAPARSRAPRMPGNEPRPQVPRVREPRAVELTTDVAASPDVVPNP